MEDKRELSEKEKELIERLIAAASNLFDVTRDILEYKGLSATEDDVLKYDVDFIEQMIGQGFIKFEDK